MNGGVQSFENSIGQTFADRYRLDAVLSRTTRSTVFKALDLTAEKVVVLKLLEPVDNLSLETRRLFESNATLNIHHPALVNTLARGILPSGQPWLVLEFIENQSLAELLRNEGYLTLNNAMDIAQQLFNAVAYLHNEGEAHLNLKPGSVLLATDADKNLFVKITNFGLAGILLERELESADQHAIAQGSTLYMSPEQLAGKRVDARSDVYSLGCILYHMLIGRPPHEGLDLLETMDRHLNAQVEFPSEPELPEQLKTVIRKMLRKDPALRQLSAQQAKHELQKALEPVQPDPPASFNAEEYAVQNMLKSSWKPKRTKRGKEPWMLLLACVTLLLFILAVQQSLSVVRQINQRQAIIQNAMDP